MSNLVKSEPESLDVIIEAILLSASEPIALRALRESVGGRHDTMAVQEALDRLQKHWQGRGLELMNLASGYRFRTRSTMQIYIERSQTSRAPRYSKSVMETLAVIAYRQPVTRADIENIRGVAVNSLALKTLEARGWIESLGVKKDSPGQPMLWGTTKSFLNDLGLKKLSDLPPLEQIANTLEVMNVEQGALPLESEGQLKASSTMTQKLDLLSTLTPSIQTPDSNQNTLPNLPAS